MDWLSAVHTLRRSWWVVALVAAGMIGSTAYFTSRQTAIYETSTTLVVWPDESAAGRNEIVNSLDALDRRTLVATYSKIPSSQTIRERARASKGLSLLEMKPYTARTSVVPDTNILRISVEGPDPGLAAEVANAIAEQAKGYVTELSSIYRFKVLDQATRPLRPVRPDLSRNLGIGAVLGFLFGIGLIFLVEYGRQFGRAPVSAFAAEQEEALFPLHG